MLRMHMGTVCRKKCFRTHVWWLSDAAEAATSHRSGTTQLAAMVACVLACAYFAPVCVCSDYRYAALRVLRGGMLTDEACGGPEHLCVPYAPAA